MGAVTDLKGNASSGGLTHTTSSPANPGGFTGWSKQWTSANKTAIRAVWGTSGSNVYAVDQLAKIHHYDGTAWTTTSSGASNWLTGIWGSSDKDIFVSGRDGVILHYDGTTWSPMLSGVTGNLWGVHGSCPKDVWVVGEQGTILHHGP